jgi:hypothetical protein
MISSESPKEYKICTLSQSPSHLTIEFAKTYLDAIINPPLPVPTLTWADILAEGPFEGEHWEGEYGLPSASVVRKDLEAGPIPPPAFLMTKLAICYTIGTYVQIIPVIVRM